MSPRPVIRILPRRFAVAGFACPKDFLLRSMEGHIGATTEETAAAFSGTVRITTMGTVSYNNDVQSSFAQVRQNILTEGGFSALALGTYPEDRKVIKHVVPLSPMVCRNLLYPREASARRDAMHQESSADFHRLPARSPGG